MMRVLLAAGADPDRSDNSGRSAANMPRSRAENSRTLQEIERSARGDDDKPAGRDSRETYGPSF
jgi:hypothetical protein